ncbi:hypothetical protein AHAS_Ahas02G0166400 [Arachis hypogaea]
MKARVWEHIMSHYVLPSTHESTITADMTVLIWCVLMEQPLNIPRLIRQAMG